MPPDHLHSRKSENDRRVATAGPASRMAQQLRRGLGSHVARVQILPLPLASWGGTTLSYRTFLCLGFLSGKEETTVTPPSHSCCGARGLCVQSGTESTNCPHAYRRFSADSLIISPTGATGILFTQGHGSQTSASSPKAYCNRFPTQKV